MLTKVPTLEDVKTMKTTRWAGLLLVPVLLTGCADSTVVPGGPAPEESETALVVAVTPEPGGETQSAALECPSGEGEGFLQGKGDEACAAVEEHAALLLEEPPTDQICTEQYGGPQTASVTGTIRGQEVEAQLGRSNGCEISRWDALLPLLQEPGGVLEGPQTGETHPEGTHPEGETSGNTSPDAHFGGPPSGDVETATPLTPTPESTP